MRQLMGSLSPMQPHENGAAGLLTQGINAWQGMRKAQQETARHEAMINALRALNPNQFGMSAGNAGGMFSMPVNQALPLSAPE